MRRALLFVAVCGCHKAPAAEPEKSPPVEVHCVAPKTHGIKETVALRGRLEPPPGGDLPVASQVAGRIVTVSVREGQRIQAGELVASVDDAPSRDALRQADAAVVQAKAQEINAALTLERTRALVGRGIAARQEQEDAQAKADAAKAGVSSAVAAADLARRTLGRVYVRSSFAGVVTRVWRGAGAIVDGSAATPIVQLSATQGVEFVADATQRELATIREGQAAHGALVAGALEFAGTVRARSSALDPATGLGTVRITLAATSDGIPMGSYGRMVITTGERDAVLVIPATAIRGAVADGAEVALCKEGKAEIRAVKVGWRDDEHVEVLEGLKPGDEVAIDHVLGLDNGSAIAEAKSHDEKGHDQKGHDEKGHDQKGHDEEK